MSEFIHEPHYILASLHMHTHRHPLPILNKVMTNGCLSCTRITAKGKGLHPLELLTVLVQEIQLVLHLIPNHQLHLLIPLEMELLWLEICRMPVAFQKVWCCMALMEQVALHHPQISWYIKSNIFNLHELQLGRVIWIPMTPYTCYFSVLIQQTLLYALHNWLEQEINT